MTQHFDVQRQFSKFLRSFELFNHLGRTIERTRSEGTANHEKLGNIVLKICVFDISIFLILPLSMLPSFLSPLSHRRLL